MYKQLTYRIMYAAKKAYSQIEELGFTACQNKSSLAGFSLNKNTFCLNEAFLPAAAQLSTCQGLAFWSGPEIRIHAFCFHQPYPIVSYSSILKDI